MARLEATGEGDEPCTRALRADLGWALGVVFRSYALAASAVFAALPGGVRGYQVLAATAYASPRSQLALAQQLGVDRTAMTYLLDALEQAGLLTREPDPTDRRARRLVVTGAGRDLVARLEQELSAVEGDVLAALDEQERASFRGLLARVAIHADLRDPAPGAPCPPVAADCAPEAADPFAAAHLTG